MITDKPSTLSLQDYLIKKIAIKMRISESIVHQVVSDQFKELVKAMAKNDCISAEISGFGSFHFLPAKGERHINGMYAKMEQKKTNPSYKWRNKEVEDMEEDIANMEKKVKYARESQTNSRRLEKRSNKGREDRGDGQDKNGDLQHLSPELGSSQEDKQL